MNLTLKCYEVTSLISELDVGMHVCLEMRTRRGALVHSGYWVCGPLTGSLVFQFFPYILLLAAVLLYLPSLFWRFAAAPHLCSDLKFIMEELDKVYNRAIQAAKSVCDQDLRDGASPVPSPHENMGQR